MVFQFKGVVMVARDDARGCQNEPVGVGDGQDVGGLGFLPSLIGDVFAPFLGGCMTAIEVEVMRVDLLKDA